MMLRFDPIGVFPYLVYVLIGLLWAHFIISFIFLMCVAISDDTMLMHAWRYISLVAVILMAVVMSLMWMITRVYKDVWSRWKQEYWMIVSILVGVHFLLSIVVMQLPDSITDTRVFEIWIYALSSLICLTPAIMATVRTFARRAS